MPKKRVLVVEVNEEGRRQRVRLLSEHGLEVVSVANQFEALSQLSQQPDLILLCNCPNECFAWGCCHVLKAAYHLPALAVTGGDERRQVQAIQAGCIGCICDTASPDLFLSQVDALLTYPHLPVPPSSPDPSPITVDENSYEAYSNGKRLTLTPIEFRLLALLAADAHRFKTQQELLTQVWGPDYIKDGSLLRLYIYHLRQKIAQSGGDPGWIENIFGVGYRLVRAPVLHRPCPL